MIESLRNKVVMTADLASYFRDDCAQMIKIATHQAVNLDAVMRLHLFPAASKVQVATAPKRKAAA
jgi:hypothetical protein